jgi:hypothetical protein
MKRIDFMDETKLDSIIRNNSLARTTFTTAAVVDSISTYLGIKYLDLEEANGFVQPTLESFGLENGLLLHTAATLATTYLIAEGTNALCGLRSTKERLGNTAYYVAGLGVATFGVARNVLEILQA